MKHLVRKKGNAVHLSADGKRVADCRLSLNLGNVGLTGRNLVLAFVLMVVGSGCSYFNPEGPVWQNPQPPGFESRPLPQDER